jgi:methylmalonyl-CoA mutase
MTINGPAPMILAMFLNAAIDQQVERRLRETGRWAAAEARIRELTAVTRAFTAATLPAGHNGMGLGLLGVTGDQLVDAAEYAEIKAATLCACAARCRRTSSKRTRRRTPASSPPSSR